jgi:hypothetical protein
MKLPSFVARSFWYLRRIKLCSQQK